MNVRSCSLTLGYHAGHYPVGARQVLDGDLHWIVTLQKTGSTVQCLEDQMNRNNQSLLK